MRVVHVVTFMDRAGSFGGPATVASNQVAALSDQGCDAIVVTGCPPDEETASSGVACAVGVRRWLPMGRFSGLMSWRLLSVLNREIAASDVVHVHLARDLVPLAAVVLSLRHGRPLFVQPHGMVAPTPEATKRVVDLLVTRRALRSAHAVFFLTDHERRDLEEVAGRPLTRASLLRNGAPRVTPRSTRSAALASVLCLARLAPRKRVVEFTELACRLAAGWSDVTFDIAGPDGGELTRLHAVLTGSPASNVTYRGALGHDEAIEAMREADLLVLPSVDEPYPMTVIEAMLVGTPVIVTDRCGLADVVEEYGAGLVVEPTPRALQTALESLHDDPSRLPEMSARAQRLAEEQFTMVPVVEALMNSYRSAVERSGRARRSPRV